MRRFNCNCLLQQRDHGALLYHTPTIYSGHMHFGTLVRIASGPLHFQDQDRRHVFPFGKVVALLKVDVETLSLSLHRESRLMSPAERILAGMYVGCGRWAIATGLDRTIHLLLFLLLSEVGGQFGRTGTALDSFGRVDDDDVSLASFFPFCLIGILCFVPIPSRHY